MANNASDGESCGKSDGKSDGESDIEIDGGGNGVQAMAGVMVINCASERERL